MTHRFPIAAAMAFAVLVVLSSAFFPASLRAAADGEITKESFFEPGLAPVRKSGPYDVTVVYFMDYQCPACRKHSPDVSRAFNEDRRLRVIYRDTPIFGPRSDAAARAAIASQFQGKHEAMHQALMQSPMPLDEQSLKAAARKAGVDWDRLQRDIQKRREDIDLQIARNMELSRFAGVAGTPAFIVGDYLANGVLDYAGMKGTIADARKDAGLASPAPTEAVTDSSAQSASREPEASAAIPGSEPTQNSPGRELRPPSGQAAAPLPAALKPASRQVSLPERARSIWPWLVVLGVAIAAAGAVVGFRRTRSRSVTIQE